MTPRTAARRKASDRVNADGADRLFRILRVLDEANRILGVADKAAAWLRTPHRLLRQHASLSLLDSDAGTKPVSDELTRIDYAEFV